MIPFLNPLLQNCTEIFTITQSRHGARMKIPKISSAICIIVRFKSNIENFSLPKLGFSDPKTTSKSSKKSLHFCAEKVLKIWLDFAFWKKLKNLTKQPFWEKADFQWIKFKDIILGPLQDMPMELLVKTEVRESLWPTISSLKFILDLKNLLNYLMSQITQHIFK